MPSPQKTPLPLLLSLPKKIPPQVFSTPESLKTTESPKDKLKDGDKQEDDQSTIKALDLNKLTPFCKTEAVTSNFWEHVSKDAKDMKFDDED